MKESNIYETDIIDIPLVSGYLKPKIYLPAFLSEEEKPYIIMHKQIHLCHKDHLINLLAFFMTLLHWFNPLVWLAYSFFSEDIERFCDETVIRTMGKKSKNRILYPYLHFLLIEKIPISLWLPLVKGGLNIEL